MGLSRLDNFLKSARGTILYVNPNDLDATDSIENQGNSLTRPFKTIQRALIESSRFSYQKGLDNDRFGKTTILLYPGEHTVDNRPGFIPDGANTFKLRNGTVSNDLPPYDLTSNFNIDSANNELFKLNSVYGGIIVPRGTSIVGLDLRKTKIRPKYVPDPTDDNIERSCIFRVTGGCYFWQFSVFDADPNGKCYNSYTNSEFVPNFSHHKLTTFEYADGVNPVEINDAFLLYSDKVRTDLDMYYEKVGLVYGQSSGRAIEPDYPSTGLDIQPKIDEFRIVGSTGESVGITSIKAGDGVTANTTVTATTAGKVAGLDVDTPFRVSGISVAGYNGQFVVAERPDDTTVIYTVQNAPAIANIPNPAGATLALASDTVTSASPYIFNVSLRSVFGMCGMLADGDKATGFKSMVVAQFTGIGLQKDDNAFVLYDSSDGQYDDSESLSAPLSTNSRSRYKPEYKNSHIKVTNNAVVQAVSVFAIGYAQHFVTESGGDISLTNSNSNFGAVALASKGFKNNAFKQDDKGYITHIIPPKEISLTEGSTEFEAIDVHKTAVGVGSTGNLYLYGQTNQDIPPENVLEGYRIGARKDDSLKLLVGTTEFSAKIVMSGSQSSSEKSFVVDRSITGINSIGSDSIGADTNVVTLTKAHDFINGESIRIISDTGQLPDGLDSNTVYFAITSGLTTNRNIKIAKTLNDANSDNALDINNKGGVLSIVSRVSDKNSGEIGHPIQYDTTNNQWFIGVSTNSTENTIYPNVVGFGTAILGEATPRTTIKRKVDNRNNIDTLYRARYVVPKDAGIAKPPSDAFIIQESNTSIGSTDGEILTYFGNGSLTNVNEQRNFRFIADAIWNSSTNTATITTELPHKLSQGSEIELLNVRSGFNTTGIGNSGFNRIFNVAGITSATGFTVGLGTDPGSFTNDISSRNTSLPFLKRRRFKDTYYIYRNSEAQKFVPGEQDGIYYLTLLNASNKPSVAPFRNESFSQPVQELFPQTDRDNPVSDPQSAKSFAQSDLIGEVVVNDVKSSITKETLEKYQGDFTVGVGITNIISNPTGTGHTITTPIEHGLNRLVKVNLTSGGSGYGTGTSGEIYNARLVAQGPGIPGQNATAKITVNGSGSITSIKIMDGGCGYEVGVAHTLTVAGTATTTGFTQAVVTIDQVYDNVGDSIRVVGVSSASYSGYNDLYRITSVGSATSVTVESASELTGTATTSIGIGADFCKDSYFYLTGESIKLNNLTYDNVSGIATATTFNSHGLKVDNKVRFAGFNQPIYNNSFIVKENLSLNSFSVIVGINSSSPSAAGPARFAYREGVTSNGGTPTIDNESLNGRMIPVYAGVTTSLSSAIASPTTSQINISDLGTTDINIGDYLSIDDEIVRVKGTVTGNPISVFRGTLGTKRDTHLEGSVVRKISIDPIELRRHSIIRASGHTFEYVGYGPGNYSTALPDKQDRDITPKEELLAQSVRKEAGAVFYTGMNDQGVSYTGNKKLSSVTGKEEIFDTPIQTVTGQDIPDKSALNVVAADEANVSRSIKVEGGDDNKVASEFNGPLIVNNKITSNSDKGIESTSIFLQGDTTVSRKYTVGISTPSLAGNPGDVVYSANPDDGGYAGWIYSVDNDWRRFGNVSLSKNSDILSLDQVGIGTTTPGTNSLQVGVGGTHVVVIDSTGDVGIGTGSADNFRLNVNGDTNIIGTCFATAFSGDGSALTNLNVDATGWTAISGAIYNTALNTVGIGTSLPEQDAALVIGAAGDGKQGLFVNNNAFFAGVTTIANSDITGITASDFTLTNTNTGKIYASEIGIKTSVTDQPFQVGTGHSTQVSVISGIGSVGIGLTNPSANLEIRGHTKLKTYSEGVEPLTISSNIATIDLTQAQTFELSVTDSVTKFVLQNIPSGSSSFTVKTTMNSIGTWGVNVDNFESQLGTSIPVNWPGGVVPTVTNTPNATDIYSFKTFDGGATLYGIVGGQNFS